MKMMKMMVIFWRNDWIRNEKKVRKMAQVKELES